MAKIQLSNDQLLVDGKDISSAVEAGSPHLRFQPDGSARLNVDLVTTAFDIEVDGVVVNEVAAPADPERVVVLAKPGDTLLIGNVAGVAGMSIDQVKQTTDIFAALGLKVIFFTDDIDIAKLPADA